MVRRLRTAYEAWFRDVSGTRPDNYAPPRIHIGTPHENPVVLTRQDWRHIQGRPWAPDSNGYWELFAASSGTYEIRLRFPPQDRRQAAALQIGETKLSADVPENATECTFTKVAIPAGNLRLLATLTGGGATKGPWQVDVSFTGTGVR